MIAFALTLLLRPLRRQACADIHTHTHTHTHILKCYTGMKRMQQPSSCHLAAAPDFFRRADSPRFAAALCLSGNRDKSLFRIAAGTTTKWCTDHAINKLRKSPHPNLTRTYNRG